jgi:hypothetical protein
MWELLVWRCGQRKPASSALASGNVTVNWVEVIADDSGQFGCVAAERLDGSFQNVRPVHVLPRDVIAVRVRQMTNELALRSAIAFTERVQRIQLPEILRRAVAECVRVKPCEILFLGKVLEDGRGGALDVNMVREQVPALANIDCSQLSGPIVDVAEQVTVDRLEVGEIKAAFEGRLRKLAGALGYEVGFRSLKRSLVGDAEAIFRTPDSGSM